MSDQLNEWRGAFGDAYVERNRGPADPAGWAATWAKLLPPSLGSILEVGCNIGRNLDAIHRVSSARLHAVEPNPTARAEAQALGVAEVVDGHAGALPYGDGEHDLVFTAGVLIHVPDEALEAAYREIFRVSGRWLLTMEYFAPSTEEIRYRDREGLLWRRDYGSLWLDWFGDSIEHVAHGFLWKAVTDADNSTWWLFRKT